MDCFCTFLCIASWRGVQMAVALFQGDDCWHALMSIGIGRLRSGDDSCTTLEAAQWAAYTGVRNYLELLGSASPVHPMKALQWYEVAERETWLSELYAKPTKPTEKTEQPPAIRAPQRTYSLGAW